MACAGILTTLEVRFAQDSPPEGTEFEPSDPLKEPGVLVVRFSFAPTFTLAANQAEAT
jgi:hypothetical protein